MIKTADDLRRYLAQAPASRPVRMAFLIGQGAVESIDYIAAGDLLDMLPEDEGLYIPDSSVTITAPDWPGPVTVTFPELPEGAEGWRFTNPVFTPLTDDYPAPMSNARITGLTMDGIPLTEDENVPANVDFVHIKHEEPEPIKQLSDPLRDPKLSWMRSRG